MKRFAIATFALLTTVAFLADTSEAGWRHRRRHNCGCGGGAMYSGYGYGGYGYGGCGGQYPVQKYDYQSPVQKYDNQSPVQKPNYGPSNYGPSNAPPPPPPMNPPPAA